MEIVPGKTLMKCGHTAQSEKGCVICFGLGVGATEVAEDQRLANRLAHCTECDNTIRSHMGLAFFRYLPDQKFDSYYCGCNGWG